MQKKRKKGQGVYMYICALKGRKELNSKADEMYLTLWERGNSDAQQTCCKKMLTFPSALIANMHLSAPNASLINF